MTTVYLKALRPGRVSPYQGVTWAEPGTWMEAEGPLVRGKNGLHVCRPDQIVQWLHEELWLVEVDESAGILVGDTQVVVRRARLVRQVAEWDERSARRFAADCAERVLPIFEGAMPGDDRPRRSIEAARAFADGRISAADLAAAGDAAWDTAGAAAGAAAWDAAWDAARAAAWAAARSAARAARAAGAAAWDAAWGAAGAAARAAERGWQTDHLLSILNLPEVTR